MTEYYKIFALINEKDYLKSIEFLKRNLNDFFVNEYLLQYPNYEIVKFDVNGYTHLFAINNERQNTQYDDRIVAIYGTVTNSDGIRDNLRLKSFIGPFTKIENYKGYDKGHFVAHKINGSLDQNIYPQLKELNRGWSKQGKLFRFLERYCQENPNTFMFTRPIYSNGTWIPAFLDYGVFTKEFGLLLNRFDNKKY